MTTHARKALVLVSGLTILAPRSSAASDSEQISDDERREAGCIDTYNDPRFDEPDNFHHNPFLLRARALGAAGTAGSGASDFLHGIGYGGRLDLDSPVWGLYSSSAGKDLGLAAGISGWALAVPDRSRSFTGELRLGNALRTNGVGWSSALGECTRRRVDLGLDFLRGRAGAFQDLSDPTHPTHFVSSVGFPGIVYRRMYPRWGFGVSAAVLDFRLAPGFAWGTNAESWVYYRSILLGVTVEGQFVPHPAVAATLGLGFFLEAP